MELEYEDLQQQKGVRELEPCAERPANQLLHLRAAEAMFNTNFGLAVRNDDKHIRFRLAEKEATTL